jgi:hypothetical protein
MTSISSNSWTDGDADAEDDGVVTTSGGLLISEPVRASSAAGVTASEQIVPWASMTAGELAANGAIVTSEPVLSFRSPFGADSESADNGSGGVITSEPLLPFSSFSSTSDQEVTLLTSEPIHTFDLGLDLAGVFTDPLMSGSPVPPASYPLGVFDASMITDAGESFNAWRGDTAAAAAGADAAGGNTANAATLATIQTIGTYIAQTSPSSAGGRHFAAGSNVTVNLTGLLLAGELMYARTALAAWARVANIHFVETTGAAQITMTDDNDAVNYNAYTSTSWNNATTISSASIHITQKWYNANGGAGGATGVLNGYGYQTYVHELGHALGLGHVGPYNGSATYGVSNVFTNDSWQFSTMSYFDQTNYGGASYAYVTSAMQADIYGMQLLYGAPTTDPGTSKFGYGANTGAEFDLSQVSSFCIYSVNGTADLDASLYNGTQTVNFNSGSFSSIKGLSNNISTALNTHLTSYEGGLGTDAITLTSQNVNDSVNGNGGPDTVYVTYNYNSGYAIAAGGTAANFVMTGTAGSDTLTNIEFVHFADGTTVTTAALIAASGHDVVYTDSNNQFDWTTATLHYDGLNRLVSETIDNDNGTHVKLGWDVAQQYTWADFAEYYDSAWRMTSKLVNNDDQTSVLQVFDPANQYSWTNYTSTFDSSHRQTAQNIQFDDGSKIDLTWDVGNLTNVSDTVAVYDTLGRKTTAVTNYDNSTHGVQVWDVANQGTWSNALYTYDSSWHVTAQSTTFDDGTRIDQGWDLSNQQSYIDYTTYFDSLGRKTQDIVDNDNGTHTVSWFDAANTSALADYTYQYNAQWQFVSGVVHYDNGQTYNV